MAPPHIVPQPIGGAWDSDLYGTIVLEGYVQSQQSALQRSERVYAEPWYRRYAGPKPLALTLGVEQNDLQWRTFQTWWVDTLVWGSLWFEIALTSIGASESLICHLEGWTTAPKPDSRLSINRLDLQMEALLREPGS